MILKIYIDDWRTLDFVCWANWGIWKVFLCILNNSLQPPNLRSNFLKNVEKYFATKTAQNFATTTASWVWLSPPAFSLPWSSFSPLFGDQGANFISVKSIIHIFTFTFMLIFKYRFHSFTLVSFHMIFKKLYNQSPTYLQTLHWLDLFN